MDKGGEASPWHEEQGRAVPLQTPWPPDPPYRGGGSPPTPAPMTPIPTRFLAPALLALTLLSGCDLVGDVLEFGFWTGVVVVAVLVAVVWFALRAFRR